MADRCTIYVGVDHSKRPPDGSVLRCQRDAALEVYAHGFLFVEFACRPCAEALAKQHPAMKWRGLRKRKLRPLPLPIPTHDDARRPEE